jgi:hypothetical protein
MSFRILTDSQNINGDNGSIFVLAGDKTALGLSNNSFSFILATGDSEGISLYPPAGDTNETIIDWGRGLNIFLAGTSSATILGFNHDITGHLTFMNAGFENVAAAVASERPDGHGGVLISSPYVSADLLGVQHLDTSRISVVNI